MSFFFGFVCFLFCFRSGQVRFGLVWLFVYTCRVGESRPRTKWPFLFAQAMLESQEADAKDRRKVRRASLEVLFKVCWELGVSDVKR